MNMSQSDFTASLSSVPWFKNVGRPSPWDSGVSRLWNWEDWPGPENPGVLALTGQRAQSWRDALFLKYLGADSSILNAVWDETQDLVMKFAIPNVPLLDFKEDNWHAPTQSVWDAAWATSVIRCSLTLAAPVPEELWRVWQWYGRGHWPCGYTRVPEGEKPGDLLVY
jgi:hypothetical protein